LLKTRGRADFNGWIDIGAFEAQQNPFVGDYNFDGMVDTADYVQWRNSRSSNEDLRADGNGDGIVNDADLAVWAANFGRCASSSGSRRELDDDLTSLRTRLFDCVFDALGGACAR
jgi:hypothetical protein